MGSFFLLTIFPLLLLTALTLLWLVLGLRNASNPTCRTCGESLTRIGDAPTACPSCSCKLDTPRSVRFRGRRRPLGLWLLAAVVFLPTAFMGTIFILLISGTVRPSTLEHMVSPTPINGPVSTRQAEALSNEELLEALSTYPDGPWGWSELHDRMRMDPPSDEEMIEVINTVDAAILVLLKNTNNAMGGPGYDCGRSLNIAINQLGYGHPRVQELLRSHLSTPTVCPTVLVEPTRLQLQNLPTSRKMGQINVGNALHYFAGELDEQYITTAIRIDDENIAMDSDGRRVWNPRGFRSIYLRNRYLPEKALEPGTHTLELDRTVVILPDGVSSRLKQAYWPKNVIKHSDTIVCEYTVEEPPTENP